MSSRAPRFGQIEIPLTLTAPDGQAVQCSCLNISQTGALLHFEEGFDVDVGMRFSSRMVRNGQWVNVWMLVERLAEEGVGVRFTKADSETG